MTHRDQAASPPIIFGALPLVDVGSVPPDNLGNGGDTAKCGNDAVCWFHVSQYRDYHYISQVHVAINTIFYLPQKWQVAC